MSNPDEQLDKALHELLNTDAAPAPDTAARRRAIAMARAEFTNAREEKAAQRKKTSQGFFGWLRLIVDGSEDNGRSIMSFSQKIAYSGMGAVAVGVIAVGLTLQNRTQWGIESTPIPATDPARVAASDAARLREGADDGINRTQPEELADFDAPATIMREPLPAAVARQAIQAKPAQSSAATASEDQAGRTAGQARRTGAPLLLEERVVTAHKREVSAYASALTQAPPAGGLAAEVDAVSPPHYQDVGRDKFEAFEENRVALVSEAPVSTFSADVDTASYSFVRRMLNNGVLPQGDAVRAEELINYFDYSYALPASKAQPFAPTVAVTDAPWAEGRKLMHIGIKGYDVAPEATPRSNLVFLLDVSGSMNSPDKLPLVKQSMELLLSTLKPDDTVAIAVYAGAAGTVLEPTRVADKQKILDAMHRLQAGGSTAGAQGIRLAYELAAANFDEEAVNRVILATDGDFNVGITDRRELQGFIERKRDAGIFLSVLGFGQGNYQDALMQALAQNGNGVAAYIDTLGEAQKVLVEEATSTLFPIAKDVKFQVEFNPAAVAEYRLIGYETRHLNREDFNNDAVDAGDIGAGHTVTAIYEFTPVGSDARYVEDSRYAQKAPVPDGGASEYAFLKIRYKLPEEDTSRLITRAVTRKDDAELTGDTGFATAVAGFAQVLKGGKYVGDYSYDDVVELALRTRGDDPYGYRNEFVQLARKARTAAAMQRR